ncbi:hypothetical protein NEDG_01494 [Nematocida displodere]|uniref:Uncharacterized protein n=1 Tax=Nematocida displodere TaxID=1805483 RepID=A0A177EDD7_9MICR|nr:hypothetical protein NEDG_01494 [Nematocida displodere]
MRNITGSVCGCICVLLWFGFTVASVCPDSGMPISPKSRAFLSGCGGAGVDTVNGCPCILPPLEIIVDFSNHKDLEIPPSIEKCIKFKSVVVKGLDKPLSTEAPGYHWLSYMTKILLKKTVCAFENVQMDSLVFDSLFFKDASHHLIENFPMLGLQEAGGVDRPFSILCRRLTLNQMTHEPAAWVFSAISLGRNSLTHLAVSNSDITHLDMLNSYDYSRIWSLSLINLPRLLSIMTNALYFMASIGKLLIQGVPADVACPSICLLQLVENTKYFLTLPFFIFEQVVNLDLSNYLRTTQIVIEEILNDLRPIIHLRPNKHTTIIYLTFSDDIEITKKLFSTIVIWTSNRFGNLTSLGLRYKKIDKDFLAFIQNHKLYLKTLLTVKIFRLNGQGYKPYQAKFHINPDCVTHIKAYKFSILQMPQKFFSQYDPKQLQASSDSLFYK